jgi:propanediol dehydratase small subunit
MTYKIKDYPLAEKQAANVRGARGKALPDLTLEAVLAGDVTIEDLRITPHALAAQADVARDAGRPRLADNFDRASELVGVPQDVIMRTYELLRPGRAKSAADLTEAATLLRDTYRAERIAEFLEEAADVYEKRGLFSKRY